MLVKRLVQTHFFASSDCNRNLNYHLTIIVVGQVMIKRVCDQHVSNDLAAVNPM